MASLSTRLTGDVGLIRRRLEALASGDLYQELGEAIGDVIVSASKKRFNRQTGPDGRRWKALAQPRARGGSKVLVDAGALRKSLASSVSGDELTVGSPLEYAATHQYGDSGTDKLGRKRNIPARPFIGIDEDDEREIAGTVQDALGQLL
ncbi:MAG: phage virion morphogenesis protein [Myxococcales bacterium]|uniref:phage virion morphogenesis protein n=1 Tax=Sediminibacterium sp. TaxID=1917865 RepID=UPI001D1CD76F|nr:phage virion morphogenesis protein [Sediminibacterium sp.]MBT9485835.1 phage virion morphogenesis protein [Sediminibacterium sp.]MBT9556862.1 phage virion morphogenesis protein [Myxococcales bacterium]